jgi:hypothetical protein
MVFVFWENRPAVIDWSVPAAFAILAPGEDWTEVDTAEVADSGRVMRETDWRDTFAADFGVLDLAKIPQDAPA